MRAALGALRAERPFTGTRRRRSAGGALAAGLALTLGVAFAAPASAQAPGPATQGSASAYGISVGGLVTVAPTPSVRVTTPGQAQEQTVLPINAAPLAINATLRARAECRVEPTVPTQISANAPPSPNNCDGFAITEGLDVLLSGPAGVGQTSLVKARVIEAEAVARCVAGRGVLATGYNLLGLTVGGADLGTPLTQTLQPVLELVGPDGALAGIVQIAQNEVTRTGDSIAINALHIRVLPAAGQGGLLPGLPDLGLPVGAPVPTAALDIIVSHAEARMPTPCGVAAAARPAGPANLGAGPVDALPRTGANQMLAVPVAFGLLTTALVLRRVNRRARRATV